MANSLESQAEEDERERKKEYSSWAPNKSRHVNTVKPATKNLKIKNLLDC